MIPILLILLLSVILFFIAMIGKRDARQTAELIGYLGSLALAWGILGSIIGLIGAFDAIEAVGNVSPPILAGGLKVALLCPLFGLVCYLVSRFSMLALVFKAPS